MSQIEVRDPSGGQRQRLDAAAIAAGWSALLDGQRVSVDSDFFFDLGGHSLLGVAIISELAQATGLPLELRDLYLAPTPQEMAGYLDALERRLAELRDGLPDGAVWSLEAFATALAELGPAAADTFLPADAAVRYDAVDARPQLSGASSRIAVLREARGNGACKLVALPDLCVHRGDAVLRVRAELAADGLTVWLSEERGEAVDVAPAP